MDQELNIIPSPVLYFRDDTHYYSDGLVAQAGGKIIGAYLFDRNLHVHCCSLTPSYEVHPLSAVPARWPDGERDRELLLDDLTGAQLDDSVQYFDATGWLKRATEGDLPTHWDGSTTPAVMAVHGFDHERVTPLWETLVEEHDGDRRAAHREFMELVMEDLEANARY